MDTSKIIKGAVSSGRYTVTAPIVKEDYGLYLQIEGVELPQTYEVDFSNSESSGTSVTMIGNADGVLIPRQFIASGKDVFAFLYHVGEDFGRTVYKFRIPNKVRPDRTDEQPTPEEQSTIDQCISALNTAVAQTAQDKADADVSAQNASADAERAEEARTDAQNYATQAEQSATDAHESASQASAKADSITGLTAQAQTLPSGSSASASYDAQTGVMSFGIPKGKDGIDGDDGYSPTVNVSKSGKVATITITDKTGTTSAQVEDGTDGTDGISPTVTITPITGGHRITITDADGTETADVMDGHNGMVTVNVTGTTPTITAQADYRYVCGEVATLDFTPSQTGICDVVFTSGSTPTVLTVPNTIKWANGFDPTALDANTTYELNIMDGLGVACAWT